MQIFSLIDMKKIIVACLCLFFVSVVFNLPQGVDYDLWWHLKYAQLCIDTGKLALDHSIFSWTPAANEWRYVAWLGDVIFYAFYQLGFMPVFYLINTAILCAIFYVYRNYLNTIGDKITLSNILGLLLFVLIVSPMLYKPEVFSLLFLAISIYIYFEAKIRNRPYFYWYPLLFLVWVNTHGLFIFGYALLLLLFTGELLTWLFKRNEALPIGMLKALFFSTAFSSIALCINPYGIGYLTYLFYMFISPSYSKYFDNMVAYMNLWSFLTPGNKSVNVISVAWYLIFMFILFLIAYTNAYMKERKLNISILLCNSLTFILSMQFARTAFFYPIIWLFSLPFLCRGGLEKILPKRLTIIIFVLIISLSLIDIKTVMTTYQKKTWFGINYMEWMPVAEADFIKKNHLPGPLFNDFLSGGYLIWSLYPEYKVFIDPRYGPYSDEVLADWAIIRNNLTKATFDHIVEKYRFRTALIHYREEPLIDQFFSSPDWSVVFFGHTAAVFVRKPFVDEIFSKQDAEFPAASRFSTLDDPVALIGIFNMYSSTAHLPDLYVIRDIYMRNVPKYFYNRNTHLSAMNKIIKIHEQKQRGTP